MGLVMLYLLFQSICLIWINTSISVSMLDELVSTSWLAFKKIRLIDHLKMLIPALKYVIIQIKPQLLSFYNLVPPHIKK